MGRRLQCLIHEAAHRLDLLRGGERETRAASGDGPSEWREVFSAAFQDLKKRAGRKKRGLRIDDYAVQDDAEFSP